MRLICATENDGKFATGRETMATHGIELVQCAISVNEIQGDDVEKTLRLKALDAFSIIGEPLVVTDDWWKISALNGFPGPYMKDVSRKFEPEDFINLMKTKSDRSVVQIKNLAYTDGETVQHFNHTISGIIAEEPRGPIDADTWTQVCMIDGYNSMTIAEVLQSRREGRWDSSHNKPTAEVWHKLAQWLLQQN